MADNNTMENIETVGFIAGKKHDDHYQATHLVIPAQSGTDVSCDVQNYPEMVEITEKLQIYTLAWIHTHPSQTAFLSAIDLHTQFIYQKLLPETVAIVCAPDYHQIEYFTIPPGEGWNEINHCKRTGFHPHDPTTHIRASHITKDHSTKIQVIDLRPFNI